MKTKRGWCLLMLKILFGIVGIILMIPIALVIVALICVSLVGGYIGFIVSIAWQVLLILFGLIAVGALVFALVKFLVTR